MKPRLLLLVTLLLASASLFTPPVSADGIVIPEPPVCPLQRPCPPPPIPLPMKQLAIRYHHVMVKIDDQIAITHVDQVFYNPNSFAVEGSYVFPLPVDATVASFDLWIDGQPVKGNVLSADDARRLYEEDVSKLRDPALLEYVGRGAVQAYIDPIPPQGTRRIELEYNQVLTADQGLVGFRYPLNTEKFSALPLESVSVSIQIHSSQPIRAVYSPSHPVAVSQPDEYSASASYEASQVRPDSDFFLYYSIGDSQAFHLLTYRNPNDPQDPDGFFLALIAPKPDVTQAGTPKDLILVLDHSGSMEGEKIKQAQTALRFILNHLNPEDRFNLVGFSSSVETFADGLQPASSADQGLSWVDKISAEGSTDLNQALLVAASMTDQERPTYLIVLTDGLPTTGETDRQKIIDNFAHAAPASLHLFAFGVGYDVDTNLLDALTQAHHGAVTYVQPGDALDETVSSFYARISTPLLTDISLDFGDMQTYDVYPQPLPDLFLGSQIVLTGRYRLGGVTDVSIKGNSGESVQTFRFPGQVFNQSNSGADPVLESLPRLWATRKIGYLLSQIKLKGADQETVDQIVKLSIRYGIVTPYTSYLVTEPPAFGAEAQQRIANNALGQIQAAPLEAASGQDAVQKSADLGAMAGAQAPQNLPAGDEEKVRIVGNHTFVLNGDVWTDTSYDPKEPTVKVAFLSKDYFDLAASNQDLASAFALGSRLIVVLDRRAYEVVDQGANVPPVSVTPTPTSTPVVVTLAPAGTDSIGSATLTPTRLTLAPSVPVKNNGDTILKTTCLGSLIIPLALSFFLALRRIK